MIVILIFFFFFFGAAEPKTRGGEVDQDDFLIFRIAPLIPDPHPPVKVVRQTGHFPWLTWFPLEVRNRGNELLFWETKEAIRHSPQATWPHLVTTSGEGGLRQIAQVRFASDWWSLVVVWVFVFDISGATWSAITDSISSGISILFDRALWQDRSIESTYFCASRILLFEAMGRSDWLEPAWADMAGFDSGSWLFDSWWVGWSSDDGFKVSLRWVSDENLDWMLGFWSISDKLGDVERFILTSDQKWEVSLSDWWRQSFKAHVGLMGDSRELNAKEDSEFG